MDCLEFIYNIYKSFTDIIEEINIESKNIIDEYGGMDDL